MFEIRPFEARDYPGVAAVWNRVIVHHQLTPEQMAYDDDQVEPPRRAARLVATEGGTILGGAEYVQHLGSYHPDKYYVYVYVDPDRQGQGLGAALYDELHARLLAFDPMSLRADVMEDHPHALGFAERRGYVQDKKDWMQLLFLESFDPDAHRHRTERVSEQGITVSSLTELGNGADANRMFYELFSEARLDVPRTEPASPLSWDEFEAGALNSPDFLPDATFLALDGDRAVGLTMSWTAGDPPELHTGLTAVLRSHRGRGIASALKVAALAWAKADGRQRAVADNDIHNVEMLAINLALGYEKQPAILSLVKAMR